VFDDGLPKSFAHINQFNVLVGGSNVLHQDSRYGYQQFNNEFLLNSALMVISRLVLVLF
jgi:hypothetical protein